MTDRPISPADFRDAARRRLPRFLFDYAAGGANDEATLRANRGDLDGIVLRQRVLRDVSSIDTSAELFGRRQPLPVALGPVGIAGMYRRRGEVQAARASAAAGVPFTLSTVSLCAVEEVALIAAPLWVQLYVIRDRSFMQDFLARAAAAGAEALVFTVDMPVPGARYRDLRSGMSGPLAPLRRVLQAVGKPGWALDVGLLGRPHRLGNLTAHLGRESGLNDYMGWLGRNFDPAIVWRDLEWLRSAWRGPLIIKGILDPADAREALALGADGIVVSNHGGRQHGGTASTAQALPAIADAVGGATTLLVDGGIASGLDIARMLALGAGGVMLGRLWLYALAARGAAGVAQMLATLDAELRVAMALSGAASLADLNCDLLYR